MSTDGHRTKWHRNIAKISKSHYLVKWQDENLSESREPVENITQFAILD